MNSNLFKLGLVLLAAFFVYKKVKNEWAQGIAMGVIAYIAANNLPFVQDALQTRVMGGA